MVTAARGLGRPRGGGIVLSERPKLPQGYRSPSLEEIRAPASRAERTVRVSAELYEAMKRDRCAMEALRGMDDLDEVWVYMRPTGRGVWVRYTQCNGGSEVGSALEDDPADAILAALEGEGEQ